MVNLTLELPYHCTEWEPLQREPAPIAMEDRPQVEGALTTSPTLLEALPAITGTYYRQAAVKLLLP